MERQTTDPSSNTVKIPVSSADDPRRHSQPGKPLHDALTNGMFGVTLNNPELIELLRDNRLGVDAICSYASVISGVYQSLVEGADETRNHIRQCKAQIGSENDLPGSLSDFIVYKASIEAANDVAGILVRKLSLLAEQGYISADRELTALLEAQKGLERELGIPI